MGQKTHPVGFRLSINKNWKSKWFSLNDFKDYLTEDIKIRNFLGKKLDKLGLSRVEIERSIKQTKVILYVSKPGLVIGRGGSGIDTLKKEVIEITGNEKIKLAVTEVKAPFLSAQIIAQEIASQIERRVPEKRIMKGTLQKVMESGAKGVKILIKGRINGQEIARTLHKTEGQLPLQQINADIDFARAEALTKYGTTGVKVWVYKGDRKESKKNEEKKASRKDGRSEKQEVNNTRNKRSKR